MKRRRRETQIWLTWMMVSAWAALAGGCSYSQEPAVLGKPEGQAGEKAGGPTADSGRGWEQEDETGNWESTLEMLDIPERYTVMIEEDGLVLTADAAVEIPDVSGLGCHDLINESFTEADFERIGSSLADRLGIDWQKKEELPVLESEIAEPESGAGQTIDTPEKRRLRTYRIEDGETRWQADYLSFDQAVRGENGEIDPSFIWWVNLDDRRWEERPSGSDTYGKCDPAMAERLSAAEALEEDARALLKEWGMDGYQALTTWWRKTEYSDRPDEYLYQIRCTPVFQGIPLGWSAGILGDEPGKVSLPYARFDYLEDGTLDVVCLVRKGRIKQGKEREMFFLPFQAVEELFEQYVRDYMKWMTGSEMAEGQEEHLHAGSLGAEETTRFIHVTRVALEYAGTRDRDFGANSKNEPETDRLVPVWTFYGYAGENRQQEEAVSFQEQTFFRRTATGNSYREMPLLSVRADDGQTFMGE